MFGSFLSGLGWLAPPKSTRAWEPTLLWNHYTHLSHGLLDRVRAPADTYTLMSGYGGSMPLKDTRPKAKAAALKPVELDDDLAEAHTSLGAAKESEWDWNGAEK